MRKLGTLFIIGFVFSISLYSQSTRISDFSASIAGKSDVLIRWVMTAGSTCRTLEVERSVDKEEFKSVYSYPGVCGGESEAISYTWVDNNPIKNQVLYYRVKLTEVEYTLLDSVMIEKFPIDDEIAISPNPSSGVFTVELNLIAKQAIQWKVFTQTGTKVLEGSTYSDKLIEIKLIGRQTGIYILKLYNNEGLESTAYLNLIN